ncbi:transcription factor LHW-like isoform X2 [Wolffia australiana]
MRVSLRETLRRLCAEIGWSYAVFWRTIWRGNSRHLVWLEGHYEVAMASTASESIKNWGGLQKASEEQVRDLVEKTMKSQVHVAGNGVVGHAAITGLHQWIINGLDGCRLEVLGEMSPQFSLGIMTIAVIPVLPHGVVQLGSTKMIPEDLAFVEHMRLRFLHSDLSFRTQDPRPNIGAAALAQDLLLNTKTPTRAAFPGPYYSSSQITASNSHSGNLSSNPGHSEKVITGSMQASTSILAVETGQIRGIQSSKPKGTIITSKLALLGSQCDDQKVRFSPSGLVEDHVQDNWSQCASDPIVESKEDMACVLEGGCRSSGDDLFDALGVEFKATHWLDVLDSSTSASLRDLDSVFDPLQDLLLGCDGVFSDSNPDQLLDAIVSKIPGNPKESLESEFGSTSTITMTRGSLVDASSVMLGNVSLRLDEVQRYGIDGASLEPQYLRTDDAGKSTRKRSRPGDGPRPRPKDRQMIQDRVKELREIVPNGAKCSIDALLERTIRHMLFLQSVTKHADMLKETGEPKIINKGGGLLLEDKFVGGATWAFEVGSRPPVCPIIVEDLHPPRRLLVEMLCEERGFFLEIADLIRGLGLTILKGVMEARKDKVWARFAVEANRDVTRMDIFMSLMRLLEPAPGNNSPTIGNTSIADKAICKSSIPATSSTERLCELRNPWPISMDMKMGQCLDPALR